MDVVKSIIIVDGIKKWYHDIKVQAKMRFYVP